MPFDDMQLAVPKKQRFNSEFKFAVCSFLSCYTMHHAVMYSASSNVLHEASKRVTKCNRLMPLIEACSNRCDFASIKSNE
ncbi:hypothetical protein T4D_5228 [Trichinella pseudospiralis]|uniref:Uncharacterized protein n=1 Tax=Trichinella pseudospiralis TaxID=6337 RepID=A0A0V1FE63_TRIPS|nr:hypothetical protein T4D_5228 [Trichinella pseudospiralis]